MCADGYRQTLIYQDDGIARPVCLKDFCGVEGFGPFCEDMNGGDDTTENEYPSDCRRAQSYTYTVNK